MSSLLKNIGIILTSIISWIGAITQALIQNPIFIILIAVISFLYLIGLLIKLVNERTGFIDKIYWDRQRRKNM